MTKDEYFAFIAALATGDKTEFKGFEGHPISTAACPSR